MKAVTLPWTQRISSGTTKGAIIGAVAGLAISFLVGGPFSLAGWCVLLSALGGIIGGIKNTVSDPVFYELASKVTSFVFEGTCQTESNLHSSNSNQAVNRYSFFSREESNVLDSQAVNTSHLRR